MAKIGIFDEKPQKWFPYDKDTEVLIQFLDKGAVNSVLLKGANVAKQMKAKVSDLQDIYLGKAVVLGWRQISDETQPGFLLPDGTPFPFNNENRNRLMTKSKRFSEWVFSVCTNEQMFLEDDGPQLEAEDMKGLDEVLQELGKEDPEDMPGNV